MLDASGAVTWQRVAGIFGDTVAQPAGDSAANPLRFPGQWADDNTGLNYNYFRDYDPGTGRYIETDPIGLEGGINDYVYADSNPTNMVDPSGLSWLVFDRSSGTLLVYNRDGQQVGSFPASNNPVDPKRDSESRPPYPNGTYPYTGWSPKPVDPNGPYGSNGVFHFPRRDCAGCEVHAGRKSKGGPKTKTHGCIRTTDDGTKFLRQLTKDDPLTKLIVK
jgi:RHS repeat-associated protein